MPTPRDFWKKQIGRILSAASKQDMTNLLEDFKKPGAIFVLTIESTADGPGKIKLVSKMRIEPASARDGNREIAEELIKLAPKPM